MSHTERIAVLLVEDDEDDYLLTRELLSDIDPQRYSVDWAGTYEAARECMTCNAYDICLLDYRLGGCNGLDLLREARKGGFSAPIVLLTGQGDHTIDIQAMRAGAADYLVKGRIEPAALERSIRYAVTQKRFEDERLMHLREQAARAEAEAANRAKDEFLAVVAHDLRTPLNAMLLWIELLRHSGDDQQAFARALDTLERSAKQQARLIEDLLDLSRIINGRLQLNPQPVQLRALIETAVEAIRPLADEKNIRLAARMDTSTDRLVGDPDRLRQVIDNLLSNAIKFTPAQGDVEIRLARSDAAFRITVTDTGQGIDAAFLPYVFERYRQAVGADGRENKGGLGLGLAIVRQLVEMHNGQVRVDSPGVDQGTTVTVTLPS